MNLRLKKLVAYKDHFPLAAKGLAISALGYLGATYAARKIINSTAS